MATGKDLLEYIELHSLECLNEERQGSVANVLKQGYREDDGLVLESDADEQVIEFVHANINHGWRFPGGQPSMVGSCGGVATCPSRSLLQCLSMPVPACLHVRLQLLINIHFNQKVKINGIGIKAKEGDTSAPKTVKLYANRASMGFSDTDSVPSSQEISLTPTQLNGEALPLKLVKFTNVTMLSIFIQDNQVSYAAMHERNACSPFGHCLSCLCRVHTAWIRTHLLVSCLLFHLTRSGE